MEPETVLANFESLDLRMEEAEELRDKIDDLEMQLETLSLALADLGEFYKAHVILENLIRLGSKYAQGFSKDLDLMQNPWTPI
jgi:hypothetical protein